jgi:hypothetical protein
MAETCIFEDGTLTLSEAAAKALKALSLVDNAKVIVNGDKLVARGSDGIQLVEVTAPVSRADEGAETAEFAVSTDLFTKILGKETKISLDDGSVVVENGDGKFMMREVGEEYVSDQGMPELKFVAEARVSADRMQRVFKSAGLLARASAEPNIVELVADGKLKASIGNEIHSYEGDLGECKGEATVKANLKLLNAIGAKMIGSVIGFRLGTNLPILVESEEGGCAVRVLLAPVID